ncbi:hypothetical protein OPV22_011344 [Ensete ventricosum]|uniref:Uncharacterized protein n=1 Tax=Ensete ventricosum TaxID=4639 RepID=A0AAV8RN67_ENSVE|nr:hypothetical protein OPV22_011344 [Ensete ventricosum]
MMVRVKEARDLLAMLSLSEERGKGDTKAAEMMSLKSLFGHHAIPGDKGHCSISNGSQEMYCIHTQEEVGGVSDEQMVAFTGERTHSPSYLIGNGPSRRGVQPM